MGECGCRWRWVATRRCLPDTVPPLRAPHAHKPLPTHLPPNPDAIAPFSLESGLEPGRLSLGGYVFLQCDDLSTDPHDLHPFSASRIRAVRAAPPPVPPYSHSEVAPRPVVSLPEPTPPSPRTPKPALTHSPL
jgi:hypothetical protein